MAAELIHRCKIDKQEIAAVHGKKKAVVTFI